jgi:flagellar protein FliT
METSGTGTPETAVWDGWSSVMGDMRTCFHLTQQLFYHVQAKPAKAERDEWIKKLLDLLNEREHVLKNLKPPFTPEEETLGQTIMKWNDVIQQALKGIQAEIKQSIRMIHNKKQNMRKYINPYASLPMDGVFYDKRK